MKRIFLRLCFWNYPLLENIVILVLLLGIVTVANLGH
jgi:hypothetical protein